MQNIECKYEIRDMNLARSLARIRGGRSIGTLEQTDTYFRLASARLKRRETVGEPTEWIHYERSDLARARLSHFTIYSEEEALERFGTRKLPELVVVRKKRELYMCENVRIHLDQVEGLGDFLEFEALVSPQYHVARCHHALAALKEHFSPAIGEVIAVSYCDMLMAQLQEGTPEETSLG